ncbi:hypothetical protein D1872_287710 [compost metagenome]
MSLVGSGAKREVHSLISGVQQKCDPGKDRVHYEIEKNDGHDSSHFAHFSVGGRVRLCGTIKRRRKQQFRRNRGRNERRGKRG